MDALTKPHFLGRLRHERLTSNQLVGQKIRSFAWRHKKKSTSRQRPGKDAIRKRFPLQKPRWENTKLTIRYLYNENTS